MTEKDQHKKTFLWCVDVFSWFILIHIRYHQMNINTDTSLNLVNKLFPVIALDDFIGQKNPIIFTTILEVFPLQR